MKSYAEHFKSYRRDVSEKARQYASGLMQAGSRKNIYAISEVVPDTDGRNLQQFITHSKWSSPDHFEALGFEDVHPNMVIRFDHTSESGWQKWRHGGWLPIKVNEVPADVMKRYVDSRLQ